MDPSEGIMEGHQPRTGKKVLIGKANKQVAKVVSVCCVQGQLSLQPHVSFRDLQATKTCATNSSTNFQAKCSSTTHVQKGVIPPFCSLKKSHPPWLPPHRGFPQGLPV